MNNDTYENELVGNISNRDNQFRTNVEPNLNSIFNELINFTKPLATATIRYKTEFYL